MEKHASINKYDAVTTPPSPRRSRWRRCTVLVGTWRPFQRHHAASNTWQPRRRHLAALVTTFNHVTGVVAPCWWGPGGRFNATTPQPTRSDHAAVTSLPSPHHAETCDRRRCNVMVRTWWPFHCNHVSANT